MDDTADSHDRAGPVVKPKSRLRCAKGAGLDERPCPVDHAVVSFKPYGTSCLLAQEWNPRRSPCARAIPHRTNLYPVGVSPVPSSLMRVREGEGSKGMGPILIRGVFQPSPRTVTHPPWIAVFLLRRLRLLSLL